MEETYKLIQQKLESAERRAKESKFEQKKQVKEFLPDEDEDFKKPVSGRSSRSIKGRNSGKTSTKTEALRAATVDDGEDLGVARASRRSLRTPSQHQDEEEYEYEQTPSAF